MVNNLKILRLLKIELLLIISLAVACNNKNNRQNGKVFRYNESKNIATLDPAFARNQAAIWPINQIYNGLVQINDSLKIIPCIAKSWNISNDGKVYTFQLRTDVSFHNSDVFKNKIGRKVTANDFVYSFNRIIDPITASPGLWIFNNVDKSKAGSLNGFKALNDSTVQIYLKSAFPAFLGLLTMPYCFVVPKEVVQHYGRDFRNHPIGTGPFEFKFWKEGEKLILVKNKNYFETDVHGNKLPRIDAVSITFVAEKQAEFLEFMKGRIDFISGINAAFKDELVTKDGKLKADFEKRFNMLVCPYLNTEYIGYNLDSSLQIIKSSPIKSKYFRLALNMAIDRKKMMVYLRNNLGFPANSGFIPKGMPYYPENEIHGYTYNPDSAKKLIQLSGYYNIKEKVLLKICTTSDYLDICEYIQNELSKVGVIVEVEVVTGLSYREMLANSRMQMFRASWIADYADAENYLALFYSPNFCPSGPNYTHFKNITYDKLYQLALNEPDIIKRNKLYLKMDQVIIDEACTIPLFYDVAIRFVQKNITSLSINPMNLLNLKFVQIQ